MSTLLYAPGVKVYVQTENNGTLDVSDDLTNGTLVRRSDGVSTFNFGLQNARRKYDGIFAPNDRIVVMMKRFTWLRVFTGYLNSVPLVTGWPTQVNVSASCSLKRLQYWYWDPGLSASQTMVSSAFAAVQKGDDNGDAGVTNAVLTILKSVVGWPEEKVHIAGIPQDWFKFAQKIAKDVDAKAEEADQLAAQFYSILGGGGAVGGAGGLGGAFNGTLKPGKYGNADLNATQLGIIKTIYNCGVQDGMSKHVISAAFCAGRAESDFNATVVNSIGATGLFQMRPSMGWGTSSQCKDPVYASHKWFSVAKGIKGRETMTYGHLAQSVERSGDSSGTIYQRWAPMADALMNTLSSQASAPTSPGSLANQPGLPALGQATGKATGLSLVQTALGLIKTNPHIPYREGGDSPPSTAANKVTYLDCSSFTQWVVYHTLGSLHGFPRTADVQAGYCGAHGKIISAEAAMKIRGALMFWDNNGRASANKSGYGHASHVEMSLGDGVHTVGSHHSGTYASVVNTKGFWHIGGLLPNVDYSADGGGVGVDFNGGGDAATPTGIQLSTAAQQPWYNPNDPFDKLFGNNPWVPLQEIDTASSEALTGVRALLNDQPLLPYLKNLFNSTMRSFCSAPNGDLIAWFPDYYGIWGTSASMVIEPIELRDFYVEWSDDFFVTHQFTVAPKSQQFLDALTGVAEPVGPLQAVTTLGIATIDIPSIMYALFGLEPDKASAEKFINWVYKRFGARPDFQQMPGVVGPRGEFFSALFLFMRQWAYQYNADIPLTFMPELFPGMNIKVPAFDFQAYCTTVTHDFKMGDDGYFNTTVNIAAPARLNAKDKTGNLIGLPIAGGLAPGPKLGG